MHVGTFVERNLLALQFGDRPDRAVFWYDDRLALRGGGLVADIEKRGAGSLGKDWRRVAAMGEIDRAHLDTFKKLRPARKLLPGDCVTEQLQPLFQNAACLQKRECADFLIAHAHNFFL